ncbi:helix-turn-helix domain-containing protein [Variovorax guangxiensis]|uniref:helix-turn-helix domain-containing protein n=1 Tax=Variovorax guangxiensis TaxID=1775474 RepID=UPI002861E331|nr:helix-turn-helix domain-containing protein [Variovorax guangxiensis]MDR6859845.1 hypothetical protein [Variovorax guangxiensis]
MGAKLKCRILPSRRPLFSWHNDGNIRGDDHDDHARSRPPQDDPEAVVDRMLRVGQAAQRLGISRGQVERRIVQRYVAEGAAGLVSRKRGRPSNHQLAPGTAERAITLIR